MKTQRRNNHASKRIRIVPILALALIVAIGATPLVAKGVKGPWSKVAKYLSAATAAEAKADYATALAFAYATDDKDEIKEAKAEAKEELKEALQMAKAQYAARMELAGALGETEIYEVEIDPADFVDFIDNPYMPLVPGTTRIYEADTEDGEERIEVTVTDETIEILGVECIVVRDTVYLDDEMIEDTWDWFVQDVLGNVWYFGELSLNYEDGRLVDVEGSWESGVDDAQPGIVMPAVPTVGDVYRQEFLLGEAEDWAEVLGLNEPVTVPAGIFPNCLKTFDGTPIEPDGTEHKFYAMGIGVVLELDPESGERVELVEVTTD